MQAYTDAEISIGDYVLTGGEFPALVLLDVVGRLLPGVLGDHHSIEEDSLFHGLLQGPQYTRPVEFDGVRVPEALLIGEPCGHPAVAAPAGPVDDAPTASGLAPGSGTHPPGPGHTAGIPASRSRAACPVTSPSLFVALLHFPVYNKAREIVATSLTTLNLHDLGRLTVTYGAAGCYVVTPLQRQRELAHQMLAHWTQGYGATYNPTRAVALQDMQVVEHLEAVEQDIVQRCGVAPKHDCDRCAAVPTVYCLYSITSDYLATTRGLPLTSGDRLGLSGRSDDALRVHLSTNLWTDIV